MACTCRTLKPANVIVVSHMSMLKLWPTWNDSSHGRLISLQAWRKPGLPIVADAFLEGGIEAAYEAFADLPHTEAATHARFKFNANVTRVCYRDDKGCTSNYGEEKVIWVSKLYALQFSPSSCPLS